MKYPKLPGGPSPTGEGDIQALERFDIPYITKSGPDSRAIRAGAFRTVETGSSSPYWLTKYVNAASRVLPLLLVPETGLSQDDSALKPPLTPPSFYTGRLLVFVGDGYELNYARDQSSVLAGFGNYWPRLSKIGASNPCYDVADAALPAAKGKSIDYKSQISFTGLGLAKHFIGLFASGYDASTQGYRWGISYTLDSDPTALVRRQPYMWVSDTKTRAAHAVTLPGETGRDMLCFAPFVVGPGKLQYLHAVTEDLVWAQTNLGAAQALKEPSLVTSADHGESWSKVTNPTFLAPVLSQYKADYFTPTFPGRLAYLDDQLEFMMRYTATFYVGNGKVMVFIPNGMKTGEFAAHDNPYDRAYQPMMFVGDAHSQALARVSWPADDWRVNQNGFAQVVGDYQVGFRRIADLHSAHFSFGVGCLFVPIIQHTTASVDADLAANWALGSTHANATTGWKIMFTHDFGTTWTTTTTAIPDAVQNVGLSCFAATVMSPWVSADKKGLLYFSGYDSVTHKFEVWSTDGTFAKWKRVMKKTAVQLAEMNSNGNPYYDNANYGVNFGNQAHKPHVFPAFPTEFGKT